MGPEVKYSNEFLHNLCEFLVTFVASETLDECLIALKKATVLLVFVWGYLI